MISQNTPNKLTRRGWLRNAAIATTGAAVLPSLLTGCDYIDDVIPGYDSTPPLTPVELEVYGAAAQNLIRMRAWYQDLYATGTQPYVFRVYTILKGGQEAPEKWTDILVDIVYKIVVGTLEGALEEIPGAGAVVAVAADRAKKWAEGEKAGRGVDAAFGKFLQGYDNSHDKLASDLLALSSNGNHYANLRKVFENGPIEFNGQKYTLNDLAQKRFPDASEVGDTDQYKQLYDSAYKNFKQYLWNAILITAGQMEVYNPITFWERTSINPLDYARDKFYPNNKARYLRGYYWQSRVVVANSYYYYASFYFTVDGKELSNEAVKELFIDAYPGDESNPSGLFYRDYVFKQFHSEKPDFQGYFDIRKDRERGPCRGEYDTCSYFDRSGDDYEFTAGLLPELMKK